MQDNLCHLVAYHCQSHGICLPTYDRDMLTKTKTNDEFLTLLEMSMQKANKQ